MDESGQSTHAHLAVIVGGFATFQFVATRYLQDSRGWSPIQMALGFCPRGSWSSRARSSRTGYWIGSAPEFSSRWGLLAFLIGYLWFLRVEPGASHVVFLLPTIVFVGLGFAICVPSVNSQHTAGVFDNERVWHRGWSTPVFRSVAR